MLKNVNKFSKKWFKQLNSSSMAEQSGLKEIIQHPPHTENHSELLSIQKNTHRKYKNIPNNRNNDEPENEIKGNGNYTPFIFYGTLVSASFLVKKALSDDNGKQGKKSKPSLDKDTWVCVRVWWPTTSQGERTTSKESIKGGSNNVGHVSIETSTGQYLSFWPKASPRREDGIKGALKYPRSSDNQTLEQDEGEEGREADVALYFYSLNMNLLEKEILKIAKENTPYVLKGNIVYNYFVGENCSSFVYRLLKAGNVDQLNSSFTMNWNIMTITPDVMGNFVIKAKNSELALYPETKEWDNNLNSEEERGCTIF